MTTSPKLGDILVEFGFLEESGRLAAVSHARRRCLPVGRSAVELGLLTPLLLWQALALQARASTVNLEGLSVPAHVLALLPSRLAFRYRCVPIAVELGPRGALILAVDGPRSPDMLDEIAFATGRRVKLAVAPEDALGRALLRFYSTSNESESGFDHVLEGYFDFEE